MSAAAGLLLEGLGKRHPSAERPALDGLDLHVEPGRIQVLLGRSGAGKTTLLRVVAGLEEADRGRVTLHGRVLADPRSRVPPERRGVGLVFQHLELWPHMTVAENVAFGLVGQPRGRAALRHPKVLALADQVGLAAMLGRSPATLSGGERQRVAIARTLAPDPAVVLYDEPLANLDTERRSDLRRLVRALSRERQDSLVVYVTHDAEEAMEIGDEIAVLSAGRVVENAPPEQLYRRPRTLEAARALGAVNALPGTCRDGAIETLLGVLAVAGSGAAPGPALALVRPEALVPGDGVEGEVEEIRPRGAGFQFRVRVGDLSLLGRSEDPVLPGGRVSLAVRGPVAVVAPEEGRDP